MSENPKDKGVLKPTEGPISERHASFVRDLLRRGRRELERARATNDAFGKGVLALYEKRYREAMSAFEGVLRTQPENGEAHYYLGLSRFMLGMYSGAVESYSAAIEAGYTEQQVVQSLADVLFLLERYEEAADAYEASIRMYPTADAYARMGQVLSLLGRRDDAVVAFKEALLLKLADAVKQEYTSIPDEPSSE